MNKQPNNEAHYSTSEYRMFSFCPYYLSSIQQGIQCAHGQSNLFKQYIDGLLTEEHSIGLSKWIREPTTICLNAGHSASMHELLDFLENQSTLAWASFYEIEGILTNLCVLVPARVYKAYDELVKNKKYRFVDRDRFKIISYTKTYKTLEGLFHSADSRETDKNPVNKAYNEFKDQYGELNVFEILLADKLRGYRLAT